MQLGEIMETAVGIGIVCHTLGKLLIVQVLPVLQVFTHDLTNLVGCIGITQVVSGLTVQIVEHLIA